VRPTSGFKPIHMPKNTGAGVIIAGLATAFGFALIWHMWLVAGLTFAAVVVATIVHTFNYKRDYHIPADEVTRSEDRRTAALAAVGARA
jgi:cytochrome o ubiquinol oxidase subunit 1